MVDADLAVLGSEPAAYQAYVTGVRAEYGQLDDEQWRTGRAPSCGGSSIESRCTARNPGGRVGSGAGSRQHGGRAGVVGQLPA